MTKYNAGNIITTVSGQKLIVDYQLSKSCSFECYFRAYIDCFRIYNKELNTNLACKNLIPDGCCFKKLKGGI